MSLVNSNLVAELRKVQVGKGDAGWRAGLDVPNPRPVQDVLHAATAMVLGITVVTRNVSDFEGTVVAIVNPWSAVT